MFHQDTWKNRPGGQTGLKNSLENIPGVSLITKLPNILEPQLGEEARTAKGGTLEGSKRDPQSNPKERRLQGNPYKRKQT